MIICNKSLIKQNGVHGTPDLIVEVLSPGTVKRDRGYKKRLYEKCGVKEYWIVDTDSRTIEIYLLKDEKLEFYEAYPTFPDYAIEKMTDEEKNGIVYEFKMSLFSDMTVVLEDVFENIL